ncbi:uncharacterized protein PG986_010322 [Apiospora aurea]|uniref:Uncharacterized protein n=1 Tax=Apiospora aurea TaxID=335848 RepID=A0ABR1Q2C4_9PEZI
MNGETEDSGEDEMVSKGRQKWPREDRDRCDKKRSHGGLVPTTTSANRKKYRGGGLGSSLMALYSTRMYFRAEHTSTRRKETSSESDSKQTGTYELDHPTDPYPIRGKIQGRVPRGTSELSPGDAGGRAAFGPLPSIEIIAAKSDSARFTSQVMAVFSNRAQRNIPQKNTEQTIYQLITIDVNYNPNTSVLFRFTAPISNGVLLYVQILPDHVESLTRIPCDDSRHTPELNTVRKKLDNIPRFLRLHFRLEKPGHLITPIGFEAKSPPGYDRPPNHNHSESARLPAYHQKQLEQHGVDAGRRLDLLEEGQDSFQERQVDFEDKQAELGSRQDNVEKTVELVDIRLDRLERELDKQEDWKGELVNETEYESLYEMPNYTIPPPPAPPALACATR